MSALPLIVFDVNETLLDLETMNPTFERIFGEESATWQPFSSLRAYSIRSVVSCLSIADCRSRRSQPPASARTGSSILTRPPMAMWSSVPMCRRPSSATAWPAHALTARRRALFIRASASPAGAGYFHPYEGAHDGLASDIHRVARLVVCVTLS
jgi:hypothetical protein